jgi:hypothetical protein
MQRRLNLILLFGIPFVANVVSSSFKKFHKEKGEKGMKKMIFLMSVFTLVAFVSGAMAEKIPPAPITEVAASTPVKAAQAPKMKKLRGAIIVIDGLKKTFDVKKMVTTKGKKKEKVMTFATDDKTKITKKKEVKAFADLKAGMDVTVAYKVEAGKNLAVDVKIATPKAAPKPKGK